MKTRVLQNWNIMRVLRLAIGLAAFVQAIMLADIGFAMIAGVLTLMAVFNIGCCGSSGCTVDTRDAGAGNKNKVIYEELDTRK